MDQEHQWLMKYAVGVIIIVEILTVVGLLVPHQQVTQEDGGEFVHLGRELEGLHLAAVTHKEVDAIPIAIVIPIVIAQEH